MFINAGKSLNPHRISQLLDVSQPAVSKALPYLEKNGLIIVKKDKNSKRLSIDLNRLDNQVVWLKRSDNLKQVYESGLVQFLYDKLPSATIILFGSYAFGEDTYESDIDLAVIGAKYRGLDITKFEKILERKIIVNNYATFQKIDKHLLNNILNGIVLKGAIEL
jgi:predicted nucleotidyltransferase